LTIYQTAGLRAQSSGSHSSKEADMSMCRKSTSLYFGKECDGCGECELDYYEPDCLYDDWRDREIDRVIEAMERDD